MNRPRDDKVRRSNPITNAFPSFGDVGINNESHSHHGQKEKS
jgi:hypothetical protein